MKTILLLSALMATFLVATARLERFTPPTYINRPTFAPPPSNRFRREASPQFSFDRFDFQPSIFENDYGRFGASFSGHRLETGPNDWAGTGGLLGSYKLGRGTFSGSVSEPFNVPKPSPTFNVEYQHSIFDNDNAQLSTGITGLKTPGHDWGFNAGAKGSYTIGGGKLSGDVTKPLNGVETRPTYNLGYQHSILETDNAKLGAGMAGLKSPGEDWALKTKAEGSYKIGDGTLRASITQPLNGEEKRPTYNVGYDHSIYKGKIGEISAGVGVDKTPGKDLDPQATVKASLKF